MGSQKSGIARDYPCAAIGAERNRQRFRRHGGPAFFGLHTQRLREIRSMASGTQRIQPGKLLHLLPNFQQGTLQLAALVETGLYFGKSDGVDDERSEVHSGVPVAVKGGGITVTRIPISQVPNCRSDESHDNARPLAR